jgi:hypothetical protein
MPCTVETAGTDDGRIAGEVSRVTHVARGPRRKPRPTPCQIYRSSNSIRDCYAVDFGGVLERDTPDYHVEKIGKLLSGP